MGRPAKRPRNIREKEKLKNVLKNLPQTKFLFDAIEKAQSPDVSIPSVQVLVNRRHTFGIHVWKQPVYRCRSSQCSHSVEPTVAVITVNIAFAKELITDLCLGRDCTAAQQDFAIASLLCVPCWKKAVLEDWNPPSSRVLPLPTVVSTEIASETRAEISSFTRRIYDEHAAATNAGN
jgi:hypothetical protein